MEYLPTQAIRAGLREHLGSTVAKRFSELPEAVGVRDQALENALLKALGWRDPEQARALRLVRVDVLRDGELHPVSPQALAGDMVVDAAIERDFAGAVAAPVAIGALVGPNGQNGLRYGDLTVEHIAGQPFRATAELTFACKDGPLRIFATYGDPAPSYAMSSAERVAGHALYRAGETARAAPLASATDH